jgi:hypothetical protein
MGSPLHFPLRLQGDMYPMLFFTAIRNVWTDGNAQIVQLVTAYLIALAVFLNVCFLVYLFLITLRAM